MADVQNANSAINLIRTEFGATLGEIKALTPEDRVELGTSIAKMRGLTEEACSFKWC